MLRQPSILIAYKSLPVTREFWECRTLKEIYHLLAQPLIENQGLEIKQHPDYEKLLELINWRLNCLADADMIGKCFYLIVDAQNKRQIGKNSEGEKYLKLSIVVHHYLGHYDYSSRLAALFHDIQILRREHTTHQGCYFRKLAIAANHARSDMNNIIYLNTNVVNDRESVINHLLAIAHDLYQEYLSAQTYHDQKNTLANLLEQINWVISSQASVGGNPFMMFEAGSVDDSWVEAVVYMRCLNENYFKEMTVADLKLLLSLATIFKSAPLRLLDTFINHAKILATKSTEIKSLVANYCKSSGLDRPVNEQAM